MLFARIDTSIVPRSTLRRTRAGIDAEERARAKVLGVARGYSVSSTGNWRCPSLLYKGGPALGPAARVEQDVVTVHAARLRGSAGTVACCAPPRSRADARPGS